MKSASRALLSAYRGLLRSSKAAVRFSGPATKNTRRYLRDEVVAAASHGASNDGSAALDPQKWVQMTTAFHLSSSLSPRSPRTPDTSDDSAASGSNGPAQSDAPRPKQSLAHRVVANMSSLTYHHLSPHTQMQNLAHMRITKQVRKPKSIGAIARVMGKVDSIQDSLSDDGTSTEGDLQSILPGSDPLLNGAHLRVNFLTPSTKPPRGPAQLKLPRWDGQDYAKQQSPAPIALLQRDLDTINDLLERSQQSQGSDDSKKLNALRQEAAELSTKIKAKLRQVQKTEEQEKLSAIPINMLANLVIAAQESQDVLLGKQRWLVRQRNGFLPP